MVSFIGRLKTFILCTFLIAMVAIIAMFYYSLRYSYASRLEIKYLGTLKIEKDFDKSDVASVNLSHISSSIQASDKVYLLQESLRSNHSDQKIKTKVLEINNNNYRNSISSNSLTNHSADRSVAIHDTHKQNSSTMDEAKAGASSDGSNPAAQDQEENLCPKSPSTLGES